MTITVKLDGIEETRGKECFGKRFSLVDGDGVPRDADVNDITDRVKTYIESIIQAQEKIDNPYTPTKVNFS